MSPMPAELRAVIEAVRPWMQPVFDERIVIVGYREHGTPFVPVQALMSWQRPRPVCGRVRSVAGPCQGQLYLLNQDAATVAFALGGWDAVKEMI